MDNIDSGSEEERRGEEARKQFRNVRTDHRITKADLDIVGGKKCFLKIFGDVYRRFMGDPVLKELFDTSHADTAVGAKEHGRRFGLFYLLRYSGDPEYMQARGSPLAALNRVHNRAKSSNLRREEHRGRGFTTRQVNTWLGHHVCTMEENNVPDRF
jgi:truncated hemoglobin YjbI